MSPKEINELEIINDIITKQIFKIFKKFNTCFDVYFSDKHGLRRTDIETFNEIIAECIKEKIEIIDIITTFERYISDYNKIISLLNDKHYKDLRRSLLSKYNVKNEYNSLNTIFKVS